MLVGPALGTLLGVGTLTEGPSSDEGKEKYEAQTPHHHPLTVSTECLSSYLSALNVFIYILTSSQIYMKIINISVSIITIIESFYNLFNQIIGLFFVVIKSY